jgi:NAD(P)H-nitrite reductase large subunit
MSSQTASTASVPTDSATQIGCGVLRDYDDAVNIIDHASGKKVIVVGGGILGIEGAVALRERSAQVTVLEMAPRIMGPQLDSDTAVVVTEILKGKGIDIRPGTSVSKFNVHSVTLSDGSEQDCDFVLVSAGIRPNLDLAQSIGLETNRGIVVDEHMRTSIPDIYAAGDCAEVFGIVIGLYGAAVNGGQTAGAAMTGDESVTYEPFLPATAFETLWIKFFSAGQLNPQNSTSVVYTDAYQNITRKLYFSNKKCVGAVFFGDTSNSGKAIAAIKEGWGVGKAAGIL